MNLTGESKYKMADDNNARHRRPHVEETLKKTKNVRKYLAIYAVFAVIIGSIFDYTWLWALMVGGFAAISYNHINNIFSGSDWTPRDKNMKNQDKTEVD